jgi:hypothetical protein
MGVMATYCQLCGLPTNHDHYVPVAGGRFLIYRGSEQGGGHDWSRAPTQPFAFGPEHAWLAEATWVQRGGQVALGTTEDGIFAARDQSVREFVGDGADDGLVFHAVCYERLSAAAVAPTRAAGLLPIARIQVYQEQLFELLAFAKDGRQGLLRDPRHAVAASAPIRQHLDAVVAGLRRLQAQPLLGRPGLRDLVRTGFGWRGMQTFDDERRPSHQILTRPVAVDAVDHAAFPYLIQWIKPYDDDVSRAATIATLDAVADAFLQAMESDELGIGLLIGVGEGEAWHFAHVRDVTEAQRRLASLPTPGLPAAVECNTEHEPDWRTMLDILRRYGA